MYFSSYRYIINFLTSEPILALELLGDDAVAKWQKLIGPEDSDEARKTAPSSLRACYGKDNIQNAVHGSENPDAAENVHSFFNSKNYITNYKFNLIQLITFQELSFFFPDQRSKKKGPGNTATLKNCTCCIIKPHAVQQKFIGSR